MRAYAGIWLMLLSFITVMFEGSAFVSLHKSTFNWSHKLTDFLIISGSFRNAIHRRYFCDVDFFDIYR